MSKFSLHPEMVLRNGKGLFLRLALITSTLTSEWYSRTYAAAIKRFLAIESLLMDFGKRDSTHGSNVSMRLVAILSSRRDVLSRCERWCRWRMLLLPPGHDIWSTFNTLMFVWFNPFVTFGNTANPRCSLLEMSRYSSFRKLAKAPLSTVFRMLDDKSI